MIETVRFKCPGCGSELETPEGAISNRCRYCGLVSRLGQPGRIVKQYYQSRLDDRGVRFVTDRHLKDAGRGLLAKVHTMRALYVPFYRFRGLSLTCLMKTRLENVPTLSSAGIPLKSFEVRARNVDLTTMACSQNPVGMASLGIRPQAVPTYAYRDQELPTDAEVMSADIPPDQAEAAALKMNDATIVSSADDSEPGFSEMIGERQSLIYFPVHVLEGDSDGRRLTFYLDGLSKRVYREADEPWQAPELGDPAVGITDLRPEPHHCPNCGADFEPSDRSLFYGCRNCDRSWLLDRSGYRQIPEPTVARGEGALYPFWRVPLAFDQPRRFNTVGAFARLLTADIPLLAKAKRDVTFYLYVPAFAGTDGERQLETAVRLTRTQPLIEPYRTQPHGAPPIVLPESEALEFASFTWNWLRMSYLNLQTEKFGYANARTAAAELIWLPIEDARLARSVQRAANKIAAPSRAGMAARP